SLYSRSRTAVEVPSEACGPTPSAGRELVVCGVPVMPRILAFAGETGLAEGGGAHPVDRGDIMGRVATATSLPSDASRHPIADPSMGPVSRPNMASVGTIV